jgi:putative DNA primase/helicase
MTFSHTKQFRMAITEAGLIPPNEILDNGKVHRFSSSGRRGDDAGWYVLHSGQVSVGAFGCWREGMLQHWSSKRLETMTLNERKDHRLRVAAIRQQGELETADRHQQAATVSAQRWQSAQVVTEHPYLTVKGVRAYGVKLDRMELLVPMRDTTGSLHSLQVIDANGSKRFQPGGRVKGCYHAIGKPEGVLIVCEGYATGASIHEATGHAVAVAFNAGNLLAVALALNQQYPMLRLIVAADDDWQTKGNPGMSKAILAAQAVDGWLAAPSFPCGRESKDTDFNDLHRLAGLGVVKASIDAAVEPESIHGADSGSTVGLTDEASPRPEVMLLNGSNLTPEPIQWLWRYWLALGKLHILAGAPGQGKTTIALAFAATVTKGGRWPDGTSCEVGNVLIWSGEDDPADTLLPRLLAAGADKARCYFVSGTRINGEVHSFDPARDMFALEEQAQRIGGIKLLIVDPVVSAVAGDSHKNTEVRRALQPLVDLANRLDTAVVGISHFSKGGAGGDPASRVVGSIAFTAVARVVLVAAKLKGEEGELARRVLARGKSNIGPDDGGFEYHIEQSEPLHGIHASSILWGSSLEGSARELLAESEVDKGSADGASVKAEAQEFLIQLLKDGPSPTKYVEAETKAAGIAWRTVRRASDALGVKKRKIQDAWYWERPFEGNSAK